MAADSVTEKSKVAHTPEPWQIQPDKNHLRIIGPAPRADDYPKVWWIASTISREPEDEANAHLIASAPDLLASLKAMVALYDGTDDILVSEGVKAKLANARAAIQKAEQAS